MRIYLFTIAGVCLFFLISLVALPYAVDMAPTPTQLAAQIEKQTGFDVTIDGSVSVRLLPGPRIVAQKLRIKAKDSRLVSAEIDVLHLGLPITGLFVKNADLSGIYVNGGRFILNMDGGRGKLFEVLMQLADIGMSGRNLSVVLHGVGAKGGGEIVDFNKTRIDIDTRVLGRGISGHMAGHFGKEAVDVDFTIDGQLSDRGRVPVSVTAGLNNRDRFEFTGFVGTDDKFFVDGEVTFQSASQVSQLMRVFGLSPAQGADEMTLRGLIYLDSERVQADNLELSALDSRFSMQLDGAFGGQSTAGKKGAIFMRLNTGFVNFANLTSAPETLQHTDDVFLPDILAPFINMPDINAQISVTRFRMGGETGRGLKINITGEDKAIVVNRFSAELPFSSTILGNGELVRQQGQTVFRGSLASRSLDGVAFGLWFGNLMRTDMAQFAERVNERIFQRLNFVTDFLLSSTFVRLDNMTGRFGDTPFDFSFSTTANNAVEVYFDTPRLNLEDWGIYATSNEARRAPERTDKFALGNVDFEGLLHTLLVSRLADYELTLRVKVAQLLVGANRYGTLDLHTHSDNGALSISKLRLDNVSGVRILATGKLSHDGKQVAGRLNAKITGNDMQHFARPVLERLRPLVIDLAVPINLSLVVDLTTPDNPVWPNIVLTGRGRFGGISVRLDASTPSRQLNFDVVGSHARALLFGRADLLAQQMSLLPQYGKKTTGRLTLDYDVRAASASQLAGLLKLGNDRAQLDGTIRPGPGGRQLDGRVSVKFANLFPFLLKGEKISHSLPLRGKSRLTMTDKTVSFSKMNFKVGSGKLSGEGRFDTRQKRPRFDADLRLDDFDATAFLPEFDDKKGWSNDITPWSLLAVSDVDIHIRAHNVFLGKLVLEGLKGRLKLVEGVLEMPRLGVTVLGGQAVFNAQAIGGELAPSFTLNGKFTSVNPASWLKQIYGRSLIDMAFDGDVDLRGRGRSTLEMITGLEGVLRLEGLNGQIDFFDLAGFRGEVEKEKFDGLAGRGTPTHVQRASAVATISEGFVTGNTAEMVFDETGTSAKLKAQLDLERLQSQSSLDIYPLNDKRALIYTIDGPLLRPKPHIDASDFGAPSVIKLDKN